MIRLLASVVVVGLACAEATAAEPDTRTLATLGMLLLALALTGQRKASKTVVYRSPHRRYPRSQAKLPR